MGIFDIFKLLEKKDDVLGAPEFIICGLGNPGTKYENTRHNCGFLALDKIAENNNVKIKQLKFKSLIQTAVIGGKKCLLMKPSTFMNKSGEALKEAMDYYKIPSNKCLVIFDDINGKVGNIRIKRRGSDGGHNGMKNIIYLTGSDDFPRIKIGIGDKPHPDYPLADWVLSAFKKDEGEALLLSLDNASKASELIISGETEKAMNDFNGK